MDEPKQTKEVQAAYTPTGPTAVNLSAHTYDLLSRRARQVNRSPDALAEEVLRRELQPERPYITLETSHWGTRAVVKDTRTPVSIIIGYIRSGLAPEDFAEEVTPGLTPAHVYDALSYYYDHQEEVDREIAENTEPSIRAQLRSQMKSNQDFTQITGRSS